MAPVLIMDAEGIEAAVPYQFDEQGISRTSRLTWEQIDAFRMALEQLRRHESD